MKRTNVWLLCEVAVAAAALIACGGPTPDSEPEVTEDGQVVYVEPGGEVVAVHPELPAEEPGETPTETPSEPPAEEPPAEPGRPPILIGAGDIARCDSNNDEATAKLLDAAFADGTPGLVFTAGDNAYSSGTASEFKSCYHPTWGRHKARTLPALGNHEYVTSGASGHFGYFGAAAGEPGKGYYSTDLGDWHIVVLNTNCSKAGGCGAGSAQERWLRADLAASTKKCTAAIWHHPRFSSGSHGDTSAVAPLWKALDDFKAELLVVGHDHNYERFAPMDSRGEAKADGIRQFVVGTGGTSLRSIGSPKPNSVLRQSTVHGVIKLTLHPDRYDWEFIPVAGKSFTDKGSAPCQ